MGTTTSLGEPPAPTDLKCAERAPRSLGLTWDVIDPLEDPVTHCEVQTSAMTGWGDVVFEAQPKRVSIVSMNPFAKEVASTSWQASVGQLQPESIYDLRVRACNKAGAGEWLQKQMMTSIRPATPVSLKCVGRRPHGLDIEWQVLDPEGAEVSGCLVEVGGAMSWAAADHGSVQDQRMPQRCKDKEDRWRCSLAQLQGNTTYSIRVHGYNAVGAGQCFQQAFQTSELPSHASALKCRQRLANGLVIEWKLVDPEGAEVQACDVQLAGTLGWYPAELLAEPARLKDEWHVSLTNLTGETAYDVRVRGRNIVGEGPWEQYRFSTAERPSEPLNLECIKRLAHELSLTWYVMVPEGGGAFGCEVEIQQARSWVAAAKAPFEVTTEGEIGRRNSKGVCWSLTLDDLEGACDHPIRVRAFNAVGAGPWLQKSFKTSWTAPEPYDFLCKCRFPEKLQLEWKVEDPEGAEVTACEAQIGGALSWSDASESGQKPEKLKDNCWRVTVCGLTGEHPIRVRGCNASGVGAWTQKRFKTSEPPEAPFGFECTRCQSDRVTFQWEVRDPEGAPVTSCDVQVYGNMFWSAATYEGMASPKWIRNNTWEATVTGLTPDCAFDFRVCCVNSCGSSPWSEKQQYSTQGKPGRPLAFEWSHKPEQKLYMQWQLPDPDGAQVLGTVLEVLTTSRMAAPYFAAPYFDVGGEPKRTHADCWHASITGVVADAKMTVRIRGANVAGPGPWLRTEFKTAGVPAAPSSLSCSKNPFGEAADKACLQWDVVDPDSGRPVGAEVTNCQLEVYASMWWQPATFDPKGGEPTKTRVQGQWQATLLGLSSGSTYDVRVRALNVLGEGEWFQKKLEIH